MEVIHSHTGRAKAAQILGVILLSTTALFMMGWALSPSQPVKAAGPIYVDASATGSATGLSWANAFTTVQDALAVAASGDEIWVAAGCYYPDEGTGQTNNARASTFNLKAGVALYGGFAGGESSLGERDWTSHITVLSGDLSQDDISDADGVVTDTAHIAGNNAYNVVTGNNVTETARLDGFVVTAGHADGSSCPGSRCGGGMLNGMHSDPTVSHVVFSGNRTVYGGGGMANTNSSDPQLVDVVFTGNSSGSHGGGMDNIFNSHPHLTDVTFENNAALYGGGLYNDECSPTMTNTTFISNTAGRGGGMFTYNGSPVLHGVAFTGNAVTATTSYGGDGSYCNGGGGLCQIGGGHLYLTQGTFTSNTATLSGAGLYLDNVTDTTTLDTVSFYGNTANRSGAGLYSEKGNLTLANGLFDNNIGLTTSSRGGGMSIGIGSSGSVSLSEVTFTHNRGQYGGGLCVAAGSVTLSEVTFEENVANANGGGLFAGWHTALTLSHVALISNTAPYGGGIEDQTYEHVTHMDHMTFTLNTATNRGGGLNNNMASTVMTDAVFTDNHAAEGGGIGHCYAGDLILHRVSFTDNTALGGSNGNGGALFSKDSDSITLREVTFEDNQANGEGGALYNIGGHGTLEDVTFQGNSAQSGGGAYYQNSTFDLQNTAFVSNTATGSGGGLRSVGTNVTEMAEVWFLGNQSGSGGGGFTSSGTFTVTNALLSGNTTSSYGGGLLGYGDMTLINVTLSKNSAGVAGGGIFTLNPYTYRLANTIVWDNTAPDTATECAYSASSQICNWYGHSNIVVGHSLVQGSGSSGAGWNTSLGTDDGGNLEGDPQFVDADGTDNTAGTSDDNLRLQKSSPAVNAGNNDAVIATTDLDGSPRIMGGTVDMGAYEYGLDIRKTVTPDTDVPYHSTVTYMIVLANNTAVDEPAVMVTDTLPPEVDFGSWIIQPAGATESSDTVRWNGAVSAGTAITLSFTAVHNGAYGDVVRNTAEYSGSIAFEHSATFTVIGPDLVIDKTSMPPTAVEPGAPLTYTLTFSNAGVIAATGIVITDTVPLSVTSTGATSSGDATITPRGGTRYVWDVGDLAPGEGGMITITGVLSEPLAAGSFANTATIAGTIPEADTSNNLAEASVTVSNVPPVAEDTGTATTEELQTSGTLSATDRNGDTLNYTLLTPPSLGSASVDPVSGGWLYTPTNRMADYTAHFTVTVADTGGMTTTAEVSVTVTADNDAPTLSAISDQLTSVDGVAGPINFTVGDAETDAGDLVLDKASSNTALVPLTAIAFGGSGADRTVTIMPTSGLAGTAAITITVTDGGSLSVWEAFTLTVEEDMHSYYLPLVFKSSAQSN